MTLFTNKEDRRLPLLTQFYQIKGYATADETIPRDGEGDPAIQPEADRFIYLYSQNFNDDAYENELTWTKSDPEETKFFAIREGYIYNTIGNWYEFFALFHYSVCDMMEFIALSSSELYYRQKIWQDRLKEWKQAKEEWSSKVCNDYNLYADIESWPVPEILNVYSAEVSSGKSFVLNDQGIGISNVKPPNPCFQLVAEVLKNLTSAIESGDKFDFCSQCENVFLRRRKDHRYCSERCASLTRKHRQRRIAAYSNPVAIEYEKWSEKYARAGDTIPEFIAWMEAEKNSRPELEEIIRSVSEWNDRRKSPLTI